jgi:hypothetical protein
MANREAVTSEEGWVRHVARWRQGGQTVAEYCREHGLGVGAMRYQLRRAPVADAPRVRLARVERTAPTAAAAPATAAVVIEVGATRVRVERGVDEATVTTVLAALGVRR